MDLSRFQKLMLINAHPVKLAFNAVGGILALYYLYIHHLVLAILLGGLFIAAGTIFTTLIFRLDYEQISTSLFGKIFMHYSTKLGFTFYSISHFLIPLAFWFHNQYLLALGLICLLVGLIKF